jgi:hypothetical protein
MKAPATLSIDPGTVAVRGDAIACRAAGVTGQYMDDDRAIMYDNERPYDVVAETLLHEVLHALWENAGLNYLVDSREPKSKGERLITALAPRLLSFLRDNPDFVRYLRG